MVEEGIIREQVTEGRRNRAFEASDVIDAFTDLERQLASPVGDPCLGTRPSGTSPPAAVTLSSHEAPAMRRGSGKPEPAGHTPGQLSGNTGVRVRCLRASVSSAR